MKNIVEARGSVMPSVEDITRRDFLVGGAAALLLGGCGSPDERVGEQTNGGYPRTVRHVSGETELAERPARIYDVSYHGAWVLLSFGAEPVEYQMHDDRAEEFRQLATTVGAELELLEFAGDAVNIEAIAAAKPDLILGATGYTDVIREQLEAIAPVIDIPGPGQGGWRENVRIVGDMLGVPNEAEELIAQTEQELAATARAYDLQGATFALLSPGLYDGLVYVCNDETFAPADILLTAGMEMAPEAAELDGDVCTGVSLERIGDVLETADILVITEVWGSSMSEFEKIPVIANMPAIEEERYVLIEGPSEQTVALDVFAPSLTDVVLPVIEEIGEKYRMIRKQ